MRAPPLRQAAVRFDRGLYAARCYAGRRVRRYRARGLKRACADGTVAVDMDPLSLPCRLATAVPPPLPHGEISGVLAAAEPPALADRAVLPPRRRWHDDNEQEQKPRRRGGYRPWAELLKRTFEIDVLSGPTSGDENFQL